MPTPDRVTHQMQWPDAQWIVLDPVPAGYQPIISARSAWQKLTSAGETGDSPKLFLALFSSAFPAEMGPNGRAIPDNDHVPAWMVVIEHSPVVHTHGVFPAGSTPGPSHDCPLGIDIVALNASTGAGIFNLEIGGGTSMLPSVPPGW